MKRIVEGEDGVKTVKILNNMGCTILEYALDASGKLHGELIEYEDWTGYGCGRQQGRVDRITPFVHGLRHGTQIAYWHRRDPKVVENAPVMKCLTQYVNGIEHGITTYPVCKEHHVDEEKTFYTFLGIGVSKERYEELCEITAEDIANIANNEQ